MSTTEAFQSGSFGFKLIGATVADGSSRVEVLVPVGELETNGGGTEAVNGTVESRRATTLKERLIIFKSGHDLSTSSRLYMQGRKEVSSRWTLVRPISLNVNGSSF